MFPLYSNVIFSTRSSLTTLTEIITSPSTHCQHPFSSLSTRHQMIFYISLLICVLYACPYQKESATKAKARICLCSVCSQCLEKCLAKGRCAIHICWINECTAKKIVSFYHHSNFFESFKEIMTALKRYTFN